MAIDLKALNSDEIIDWCPGCGNNGILLAIKNAIVQLNEDSHNFVIVSGIGCSSKLPHFINVHGVHTLHGRAIPFAEGIKLANPSLNVLVTAGDGDTYGIGLEHFLSVARRNTDIKVIVHDNGVYSLTKGQPSPTLPLGYKVKGWPFPNINAALNPLALAITAGYTFVARTHSFNVKELTDLIVRAIKHKGLAVIDVLQGCPTYNEVYTSPQWFAQHLHPLPKEFDPVVHNPNDPNEIAQRRIEALRLLLSETPENMYTGLFFEVEQDTFEDRMLKKGLPPPISQQIEKEGHIANIDLSTIYSQLGI